MAGILSYGAYVPRYRLAREDISVPLTVGVSAAVTGLRSVAGFDEDTTSLAVEAGRAAMKALPHGAAVDGLFFSTANPAYVDKTNATTIHAALGLPKTAPAIDVIGSPRTASAALHNALRLPDASLVVLADVRAALPGSGDERDGADAAVAFVMTGIDQPVLAELIGSASQTAEFLDRWRLPHETTSRRWEERFGQEIYIDLGTRALTSALVRAGLAIDQVDHLVLGGLNGRAFKLFAKSSGVKRSAMEDSVASQIGNAGVAHAGLQLADVLDRAKEGAVIAVVTLADGAEALLFRVQDTQSGRPSERVATQLAGQGLRVCYSSYLEWRGLLRREQPRRPDPSDPPAPSTLRAEAWKLRFSGSRCMSCGEHHFPPQRVCQRCDAVDRMEIVQPQTGGGRVVTSVIDRTAWSPAPPITVAIVDLDGGGRAQIEVTETDGVAIGPGSRVELTFRKFYTTRNGIHNYFWKARPVTAQGAL